MVGGNAIPGKIDITHFRKTTSQLNPVRTMQIARSESEKADEDCDQATKEQRYTKRDATPDRYSADGRKLPSTKRVVSVGCFADDVSMSDDLRGLTRIRPHVAIYFSSIEVVCRKQGLCGGVG